MDEDRAECWYCGLWVPADAASFSEHWLECAERRAMAPPEREANR